MQSLLTASQVYQQSLVEDYQTSQEQLTASNEELQSANEELQSTNEELETAKEELQSTNEELTTVNDELNTGNVELKQLTNDLLNLLANIENAIVILGRDKKIRRFTPSAGKMFKLQTSDIGKLIGDIKINLNLNNINLNELVTKVLKSTTTVEVEICDLQNIWYLLQVKPYRVAEDKISGVVLMLTNIDVFKRELEKFKDVESDTKRIIEAIPLPVLVIDAEKKIKKANRAFYEKFNLTPKDVEALLISELCDGQWNNLSLMKLIDKTLKENIEFDRFEITANFPKIGPVNLLLHSRVTHLPLAGTSIVLLIIEDVTEKKQLEKEKTALQEKQKLLLIDSVKANLTKDEFLATLSHELRTPLTSILGWAQELRSPSVDKKTIDEGLTIIERSAQVQGQLINDLLDVSRIQSGKLFLNLEIIDLVQVLEFAVESISKLAEKKSIHIKVTILPEKCLVSADVTRIQQVLWNLLTNAVKFTPPNGKISIKFSIVDTLEGRLAQIQITDSGIGIKPEFLTQIFQRFKQVDSSMSRTYGGLGLGLAIAKSLIEMQKGTIKAESLGEGKGTTFTIRLPLVLSKEITADGVKITKAQQVKLSRLDNVKVLAVDDNNDNRILFSIILKSLGAEVRLAESVAEALKILAEFIPEVILSDISMPDEDGYSLLRKVRVLEAEKNIKTPIIALTAHAGPEDAKQMLEAGFSAHIAKPVDKLILANTIAKLVDSSKK